MRYDFYNWMGLLILNIVSAIFVVNKLIRPRDAIKYGTR